MLLFSGDYLFFMLPAFILVMVAQWWVSSTYRKWSRVENGSGLTGAEAAKRLLQYGGVSDVSLDGIAGQLTDHYDPRDHTLRLSAGVANGRSVASLAIAAHEIATPSRTSTAISRFAFGPRSSLSSTTAPGWACS